MSTKNMGSRSGDLSSSNHGSRMWYLIPSLVFSLVVAASTALYTFYTHRSVEELRASNAIQMQAQRPYVSIESIRSLYDINTTGTEDELWLLQALLVNKGQVLAVKVKTWIYWDENERPNVSGGQEPPSEMVLSPYGGSKVQARPIARKEAEAIIERSDLFVHTVVHYEDPAGVAYYSTATVHCKYRRGEFLNWTPVHEESGRLE